MDAVQTKILEIYIEIKKVCDKHNITYFAIGGTCLGAVRHQGFIPWDDDMDIAIPIEDFYRFLELCSEELPDYLSIYSPKENPHYCNIFCKIVDKRTAFIENTVKNHPDSYWGVFVDVMPMSGLPSRKWRRTLFIFVLRRLLSLNSFKRRDIYDYTQKSGKRKYRVISLITNCFSQNWFVNEYYKMMQKYPLNSSILTGYSWSKTLKSRIFDQKIFSATIEFPFEDTTMKCPIGYADFLSSMFGDYMKFPPEAERTSGHVGLVDLKHSYLNYKQYYEETGEMPWINQI